MNLVAQHLAHETPDYTFELDEYMDASGRQFLLAHIRLHRWSPSVLKRLLRDWATLRQCVTAPLFGFPDGDDARWIKFVSLLGFRLHANVPCNDGVERPLFIHTI